MLKLTAFISFFLFSAFAFSQANIGFELGNTSGWICKYGYFGSGSCPALNTCSRFNSNFGCTGQVNYNGINAPINGDNDRHTIVSLLGGYDSNSVAPNLVPMVAPGGGNYSFRLGNGVTGRTDSACGSIGQGTYALAEAVRLTFAVTTQNAAFTYRYAFFAQSPNMHGPQERPVFEVVALDKNDSLIPCGRYLASMGSFYNCSNVPSGSFLPGTNKYSYLPWTTIGLDLTPYIGQNISIEFRTNDCVETSFEHSTPCAGNTCTYCCMGYCCTYTMGFPECTPSYPSARCCENAMNHASYAYIDAYVTPVEITVPDFCAGTSGVNLCAPPGYVSYSWPAGQPGLSGPQITQCVNIANPVSGNTYTVNMVSATGCISVATVTLQASCPFVNSEIICPGDSTILVAQGAGPYSWNTGTTTSSILVFPSATTTYSVTAGTGTAVVTATSTVTVAGSIIPVISGPSSVCAGSNATLIASGGSNHYSWSTGDTGSAIIITPTSTSFYTVVSTGVSCSEMDTFYVGMHPVPAPSIFAGGPTTFCQGDSVILTANAGASAYEWSTSETTQSIVVKNSGAYHVIETNNAGCFASSSSVIVKVNQLPSVKIYANGLSGNSQVVVCQGDSLRLQASGGTQWLWSTGSTVLMILVKTPGVYYLTGTDVNGCSSTSDTLYVTVTANFPVAAFSFSGTVPAISFSNNTVGAITYLWDFGDGAFSSNLSPSHTYTANGTYTVCLTAKNVQGCADKICKTVTINTAVWEIQDIFSIDLYPNPLIDEAILEFNLREASDVSVGIYTLTGGSVYNVSRKFSSGKNKLGIQDLVLESGIYFMKVLTGNSVRVIKAVVVK